MLPRAVRQIVARPPHATLRRVFPVLRRTFRSWRRRRRDANRPSYLTDFKSDSPLARFLSPVPVELLHAHADPIAALCRHYLDHRFDLLGSGWVQVRHGVTCRGLEGHRYDSGPTVAADRDGCWLHGRINQANGEEARSIWQQIRQPYTPIDWQLDFKSGHRWSESQWHEGIAWGALPGVDVKVPWELARMQHLPQLALGFALARNGQAGFADSERYAAEYRNQVLDFIATNPPRFGVNWRCTMDVAIRAANLLVAHDLFLGHGATFDEPFKGIFHRSVVEHGRHIASHLEKEPDQRNNHYLSNIAGLLFVAGYLPPSRRTDRWLQFAADELQAEIERQFLPDGGNFEASTSYHRLSTEIVLYGVAMLRGLQASRRLLVSVDRMEMIAEWLEWMIDFTSGLLRADGTVPQIGDNDSGRFIKLLPAMDRRQAGEAKSRYTNLRDYAGLQEGDDYWYERPLDHRHLLDAAAGLLRTESPTSAEAAIIRSLARKPFGCISSPCPARYRPFSDFGLYTYRFARFTLILRCGPVGQQGVGGHAHNDQLSFELAVGGRSVVVDPGTYLYTPDPDRRNIFRGTAMHNTLVIPDREQNGWEASQRGLFSLRRCCRAHVVASGPDEWIAEHDGFGEPCRRRVGVSPGGFTVCDDCGLPGEKWAAFHLAPGIEALRMDSSCVELNVGRCRVRLKSQTTTAVWVVEPYEYSPAYGWAEPAKRLRLLHRGRQLEWQVDIEDRP